MTNIDDAQSDLKQVGREPIGGFLGIDAPERSFPRNFENNDAVVVIDDALRAEDAYDLRWGPRCFNDPDGLKRPAKINGGL